jgi:3-hydroxyisobutyrate dehydrogenase-like beta-hydroxyacid dehydrogenase
MITAVLGIGHMGAAIARLLVGDGHQVVVWNRSPGKVGELVEAGAREAPSLIAAVEGAEVVVTSLSDDSAVRQVALSEGGLRGSIADDVVFVETSTVSPALTTELVGVFPSFLAMPILGGPVAVEARQATYLAGGSDDLIDRIQPITASLGGTLRRYRAAGLASTAKLTVNLMLLSGVVSLAESFTVGRSGGLSDDELRQLLGGVVAPGLKNRFEALLGASITGWWTTTLGAKDVGLAIDVAGASGTELTVAEAVRAAYLRVASQGFENDDIAAVRELYRP